MIVSVVGFVYGLLNQTTYAMNTIPTDGLKLGAPLGTVRSNVSPMHRCPKCKSYTNHRIANGKLVDKILFWMSLKRYHCRQCDHRFYIQGR